MRPAAGDEGADQQSDERGCEHHGHAQQDAPGRCLCERWSHVDGAAGGRAWPTRGSSRIDRFLAQPVIAGWPGVAPLGSALAIAERKPVPFTAVSTSDMLAEGWKASGAGEGLLPMPMISAIHAACRASTGRIDDRPP